MLIRVLKPADAPPGIQRLMPLLQESLANADYVTCRIIVAFARLSGIARLLPQIRTWRARRGTIEAMIGIDRFGTSREALEVLLDELDAVYITYTLDEKCTFHPKMYLFQGPQHARAVVGSHNLTLGGLETNLEGGVVVDLLLPGEAAEWVPFSEAWNQLLPETNRLTRRLDAPLLEELIEAGYLLPELQIARSAGSATQAEPGPPQPPPAIFNRISPAPPSPLPRGIIMRLRRRGARKEGGETAAVEREATIDGLPRALVTEIIPHHNGEILLSKTAADAFPAFFGLPFTGRTVPKRAGNPGYPMRVPDPIVEWRLYGTDGNLTSQSRFPLNTVLYERKMEVRITVTPPLARAMPEYSVMVMWGGSSQLPPDVDYVVDVFVPGSPGQQRWQPAMNLTLPGGGRERARRMGWI